MTTTPLTPEAVASLTDAELSEAVARVVLGLPFYDRDGDIVAYSNNVLVALSPEDAGGVFSVLNYMRTRWLGIGWRWRITEVTNGWVATALDGRLYDIATAYSESMGRAVFECALLAAQEMEKEG